MAILAEVFRCFIASSIRPNRHGQAPARTQRFAVEIDVSIAISGSTPDCNSKAVWRAHDANADRFDDSLFSTQSTAPVASPALRHRSARRAGRRSPFPYASWYSREPDAGAYRNGRIALRRRPGSEEGTFAGFFPCCRNKWDGRHRANRDKHREARREPQDRHRSASPQATSIFRAGRTTAPSNHPRRPRISGGRLGEKAGAA